MLILNELSFCNYFVNFSGVIDYFSLLKVAHSIFVLLKILFVITWKHKFDWLHHNLLWLLITLLFLLSVSSAINLLWSLSLLWTDIYIIYSYIIVVFLICTIYWRYIFLVIIVELIHISWRLNLTILD